MADELKTRERLAEFRKASDDELDAVVAAARKRIYLFRKDRLSKPQEDVKVVHNNRKNIARVLTIKRERELAANKE
ncbi:MAG: 50S ribosomal protein L29 [Capsulimonadaceae bacterium]